MDYLKLIENILESSKGELEEAEVLISTNKRLSIQTFQGEIDKHEIAESGGLSLRGIYNGKMGYTYTEKIDDDQIKNLIQNVKDNSIYLENEDDYIYPPSKEYEKFTNKKLNKDKLPLEDKIEVLLNLEKEIRSKDSRVYESQTGLNEMESKIYLGNTKGALLEDSFSVGIVSGTAFIKEGEETKTGSAYRYLFDYEEFKDYKMIANEVVEDGISKLGAEPVSSGEYKVIFKNETFSELLSAFVSTLSGESVEKNLSLFKGKLGEVVGSEKLTLVDNPFLEKGFGSGTFDLEGEATRYKEIIKDGVLKTFLHNNKTAKKQGIKSTGNASRSYKGSMGISPTNLYIINGENSFEELLNLCEVGLYIDDLQGLHSGLNSVSGDFSLSASGHLIEERRFIRPINQITIAGNLFDLLKDIQLIGNDLKFGIGAGGNIGSPSILIEKLAVSGK